MQQVADWLEKFGLGRPVDFTGRYGKIEKHRYSLCRIRLECK